MSRDQLLATGTVDRGGGRGPEGPLIVGAARAGLIDVLVTDEAAATTALEHAT